jgi:hypothetical protein
MVCEDRSNGFHPLFGERCQQLADSGPEHLHHLVARNGEAYNGSFLDGGLDDLWHV